MTRVLPEVTAPAPLEFVAWLCADACRVEFASADPLPYHAGAPATRLDDHRFEIRYQQRADGRWTARADGRLLARPAADGRVPDAVEWRATDELLGWSAPVAEFVVRVERDRQGVIVRSSAHGCEQPALERHLPDAVRFATELTAAAAEPAPATPAPLRPCCARHAPWCAVAWVHAGLGAERRGELLIARDALRAALAQAPHLAELEYRIGALDRALGQDRLAVPRLRAASRRSADQGQRSLAALAARASQQRATAAPGDSLRDDALAQLAAGRFESALALAHAARATDPDAVADLRLRHRLQRTQGDPLGSLGTALLLREYARTDPAVDDLLAEDFARVGHWQLAHRAGARMMLRQLPLEMLDELRTAGRDLAAAAAERWARAQQALAAPPK
ncbi:MAG: hypothetical protein AB7O97_00755 [Planctomycetota bacterium]